MDLGLGIPEAVVVLVAAVAAGVLLAFLARWTLRVNQIVWLLARVAGLPEEAARRRTLRGMIQEARRAGALPVPEGEAPGQTPSGAPRRMPSPAAARWGAKAAPEVREEPKPAGPRIAGREVAFQDRLRDAEGNEFKVVGSVSSGLLVETQTGARDVIIPTNPDDARKDWIYPVGKIDGQSA